MAIWSAEIKELEKLYESFKGQLPELERELERLIKTNDENIILVYSRRSLEVIVTDLCECELKRERGTEPLKGIIDKLNKEKKVPSNIIISMDHLNSLSAYGAHPKHFDPEQVKPVLNNLDIIVKWYLKYKGEQFKAKEKLWGEPSERVKKEVKIKKQEKSFRLFKNKLLSRLLIIVILVVAALIVYQKFFRQDTLERLRSSGDKISVAVMPFQNMTGDTTWNIWQEGIQNELISSLTNSQELTVRQTETINNLLRGRDPVNYASVTPSAARNISQKIKANFYIYGTIKQAGEKIRINTQLVDPKSEEILRSFEIDGQASEEMIFQVIDSLKRKVRDYLIISKLVSWKTASERDLYYGLSNSPEAFRYYSYGRNAFQKRDYPVARNWFQQALEADSNLLLAVVYISTSYGNQGLYEDAKKWCLRLYSKRDYMSDMMKLATEWLHAAYFETPKEEIRCLKQILEIDEQSTMDRYLLGWCYFKLGQYDKAIPEFEKTLELYEKVGSKPMWVYNYTELGEAYHETGKYRKERKLYKKAEKDFAGDPELLYMQAILALSTGKVKTADENIELYISALEENSTSEAGIDRNLGRLYSDAGQFEKAENYYRKALSIEPENPNRLHSFAWFLINNDRNIDKGIELVNRALELSPDDYNMLDTKGWGLYKQGKYQEAFEFLQKSWDLLPVYDHDVFLRLEAAKKALAEQKNN
jgi:tetratricopeptide (TPR) repeat protein